MEDKYIKLSDAKNALADYIAEQTVSKYGSLESCMDAKFAATGAMNELDYVPAADVVPKSEIARLQEDVERLQYINSLDVENLKLAKAEVVREIFEELRQKRNELWNKGNYTMFECWCKAEEELKKKYTENENDRTTGT